MERGPFPTVNQLTVWCFHLPAYRRLAKLHHYSVFP